MNVSQLPHFIEHAIYDDETGEENTYNFFLSISRDLYGKWSVGYVSWSDFETNKPEYVIPQLFFNSAESFDEIAIRMSKKLERFEKLSNS